MIDFRAIPLWKDVTDAQWNDWHWQVTNRITTVEALRQVIDIDDDDTSTSDDSVDIDAANTSMSIRPISTPGSAAFITIGITLSMLSGASFKNNRPNVPTKYAAPPTSNANTVEISVPRLIAFLSFIA